MFLLHHVPPEEASGQVAEAYSIIPPNTPVPEPLQLMSVSPGLAAIQSQVLGYFMNHDKLDFGFFAMLRLVAAQHFDYAYCKGFNATLLARAGGFSDGELSALLEDPHNVPLDDAQKALFLLAVKSIKSPVSITSRDVQQVRDQGWSDKDIFDVCYHAAMMQGMATLYKAFRNT